jgi:hypothetical protein
MLVGFPARTRNYSLIHTVQTDSGTHPVSYPMSTGVSFSGESGWGVKLTTHLHLVPRSIKVELWLHSPIRLHGVVLHKLSTRTTLLFCLKCTEIHICLLLHKNVKLAFLILRVGKLWIQNVFQGLMNGNFICGKSSWRWELYISSL